MPGNIERRKRRDKRSAVIGVVSCEVLMLLPLGFLIGLFCIIPEETLILKVLLGAAIINCIFTMAMALVVLVQRFKEIEGGELDAAAEY